jgi:hypothetical protein
MAILRGVSGKVLDCGCLVGVYETYGGRVVHVVDAVGEGCTRHQKGDEVPKPQALSPKP